MMNNEDMNEEFGRATEDQNCLAEAQMESALLSDRAQIELLASNGRFCVIEERAHYCRATDALAGTVQTLVADFGTYSQAFDYAMDHVNKVEQFEVSVLVVPSSPMPAPCTCQTDDIPF